MRNFKLSPYEMMASLWRNRRLIITLSKREVIGRYKGSALGLLWSFFNPVFMLAVYTFVFSVVFRARWSGGDESKTEFALVLFAGMIVFNFFSECFNRAPSLILSNANYVKKVVFPLEVLPWVIIGSSLFHALVSAVVWLAFYTVSVGVPNPTILLLPFIFAPLAFLMAGIGWILASLGVYLRDVGQVVGLLTTVLLFLSPIFYPISALPESIRPILSLNPLAPAISQVRDVLYWGAVPNLFYFSIYSIGCVVLAMLGFAWFQKTRKGFADVI